MPSPLLYDGLLYLLKSNNGILSVFDAKTGKPHYRVQRLDAIARTSSRRRSAPTAASISPARTARLLVIRHGPTFEVLATNMIDDGFMASPALVDNEIYLRGNKYLYCIAEK